MTQVEMFKLLHVDGFDAQIETMAEALVFGPWDTARISHVSRPFHCL